MKYLPILVLVSLLSTDIAIAQGPQEYCEVTVTGRNRNRLIDGAVNVECGYDIHSAPLGNWGVSSNYGDEEDTDQFRGWQHEDGPPTKLQWNSCTTWVEQYQPPSTAYYTPPTYTDQRSADDVRHGFYRFRMNHRRCPRINGRPTVRGPGCSNLNGYSIIENNYMSLYELDWDGDDFVTTLYFPSPSLTFSGCDRNGCSDLRTPWKDPTSSTNPGTGVTAEMRVIVETRLRSLCRD